MNIQQVNKKGEIFLPKYLAGRRYWMTETPDGFILKPMPLLAKIVKKRSNNSKPN